MDSSGSSSASEDEEQRRRRRKKEKKQRKEEKKEKKRKKKHKRRRSSSSSHSTEGNSSEEELWVEAGATGAGKKAGSGKKVEEKMDVDDKPPLKKGKEEDDEWANFGNVLPTFSNDSRRAQRQKEKEEERREKGIDKAGQHERELNPYWKDGGKGLPMEEEKPKATANVAGDGGLMWLKRAFQRAKEQAQEEGKPLEEIVSLRWGSLEAFYALLEEAERKADGGGSSSRRRDRERDRDRDRDDRRHKSSRSFKRPDRESGSEDERSDRRRSHTSSRQSSSGRYSKDYYDSKREEKDAHRNPGWMKAGSRSNKPDRRSRSIEREENKSRKELPPTSSNLGPAVTKQAIVTSLSDDEKNVPDNAEEEVSEPDVLTDKEMNELNAKIFKAEMLGNQELLESLKSKLESAEAARQNFIKNGGDLSKRKTKVITKVIMSSQPAGRRKKDKLTETHKDGERVRYFPDDDKYTLKTMFEREKMTTAEDENALFSRLAGKSSKASGDYDADEIFVDKASSSRQEEKEKEREVRKALDDEKEYNKVLEGCAWCFDGSHLEKNLVVSIGKTTFLCVPPYQSLTDGHCLIVPMSHVSSSTQLDEDVWSEIQRFRKALVQMFREDDQDCVFFETAVFLKKQPHMYLECVPMPKETGELAPIYFKKAIQECETEWSQNKKLVDMRNRDVRKAIPKGLPYFSVEFADDNCGFAHVIEDEINFQKNFAQEIVGGMLELDHQLWRKQKKDDFHKQRAKLMNFLKMWAPYDWTRESNASTTDT